MVFFRFAWAVLIVLSVGHLTQADILYQVDFETGDLSKVHSIHKDDGTTVAVVPNPDGPGLVMKSAITPAHERAEVRVRRDPIGSERWYGWSLFLASDYVEMQGKSDILFQWHRGGGAPRWATRHPMTFMINSDGKYQITYTFQTDPSDEKTRVNKSQVIEFDYKADRGRWVHWALHARWSPRDDGYMGLYRNGRLTWAHNGANWLNWGAGPMVKAGIYAGNPGWKGNDPTVVYHDNIVIGDEKSSIEEVSPHASAPQDLPNGGAFRPIPSRVFVARPHFDRSFSIKTITRSR